VLSATNAELKAEWPAAGFPDGFALCLNALNPPAAVAREALQYITALASLFSNNYAVKYRKQFSEFDAAAMRAMLEHEWPGQRSGTADAIEREVLLAQGDKSQEADSVCAAAHRPQRLEN